MHYKQENAVVKCSLFAEASGLSGKSNRRRKVAGMERWKSLAVASVGILAMPVMFASNSYAVPPPIIELTSSQSNITVNEGESFDITIWVKNNDTRTFNPIDIGIFEPVYVSPGDNSDSILYLSANFDDINSTIYDTPLHAPLKSGESSFYIYTFQTVNDGAPFNDGDGYWLLPTNVSGTFLDGTQNGTPYESATLEIPVTVRDVVPEPSTYALMGVGGLLLALRLRKSGIASMFTA
jgi:hypothetical protein